MPKRLTFECGEPRDACEHDPIVLAGQPTVCRLCGRLVSPADDTDHDHEDAEATE